MTEQTARLRQSETDTHAQPEAPAHLRLVNDSIVRVIGVETKAGALAVALMVPGADIPYIPLGFAEEDGSEQEDNENTIEKPLDDIALLKKFVETQSKGNTQKVALYLAKNVNKKFTLAHLIEVLEITKFEIDCILKTIKNRAVTNQWPATLSYSLSSGAGFIMRKQAPDDTSTPPHKTPPPVAAKTGPSKTADKRDLAAAERYARDQAREGEEEILLFLAHNLGRKVSFAELVSAAKLETNPSDPHEPISRIRANTILLQRLTNILGFEKDPRYPFYLEVNDRRKHVTMIKNPAFA